jgi:hypothetical protein
MKTEIRLLAVLLILPIMGFPQDSPSIDSDTKGEVVQKVASIMKDKYVFSEIGENMAKHIIKQHEKGSYDSYTAVKPFCRKLTSDLRDICHDKHIFVFYSPEEAREVAARNNLLPNEEIKKINEAFLKRAKRGNFGFSKIEILKGNIGYMNLNWFSGSKGACDTANNVMGFLSNTDAIIIDLRNNIGGGGDVLRLLASYFFNSGKMPLTGVYYRSTDRIEKVWTLEHVPGRRRPDVDLYILTSSRTFSAAEDFCYSLKALKRATVIGEKTKGGAHPVDVIIVKGNILTQISIGNSYNPITKTNWEGVGVNPDIETAAEDALKTAHLVALERIKGKTSDNAYKKKLEQSP